MTPITKNEAMRLLRAGKQIDVYDGSTFYPIYDYIITGCGNIQWICILNNKFIPDIVVKEVYGFYEKTPNV